VERGRAQKLASSTPQRKRAKPASPIDTSVAGKNYEIMLE
jgi:hypothetical protein